MASGGYWWSKAYRDHRALETDFTIRKLRLSIVLGPGIAYLLLPTVLGQSLAPGRANTQIDWQMV